MKITQYSLAAACGSLLISAAALAAPADDLLAKLHASQAKLNAISTSRNQACAELSTKRYANNSAISALAKPATDAQISNLQNQRTQLQTQLTGIEQQLEIAKLTDPAVRLEKKREIEKENIKIDYEINVIGLPFNEQTDKEQAILEKPAEEFGKIMSAFFREPTSASLKDIKKNEASPARGFNGWQNWGQSATNGEAPLSLSYFVQDKVATVYPNQKTIDGKYRFSFNEPAHLWVDCGYIKIAFTVSRKELQNGQDSIIAILKEVVDLEGISRIGAK